MESQEALEAFLLWLGGDNASGAQKYEEVRRKLILLFRFRGCSNPEDLADETIDRTAGALLKRDFTYEGEPMAYFRGVARNVYLETQRRQRIFSQEPISGSYAELAAPEISTLDLEISSVCLEGCLAALNPAKKLLLLRYYRNDKGAKIDDRQQLAEEEGIGLNALRIQIFRLRNTIRHCVETCLGSNEIQVQKKSSYL